MSEFQSFLTWLHGTEKHGLLSGFHCITVRLAWCKFVLIGKTATDIVLAYEKACNREDMDDEFYELFESCKDDASHEATLHSMFDTICEGNHVYDEDDVFHSGLEEQLNAVWPQEE